jgi:hypothetical protein
MIRVEKGSLPLEVSIMVRAAAFLVLFSSLTLMAQRTDLDRSLLSQPTICDSIGIRAQMVDASDLGIPSQRVKITLNNLTSKAIVLERFTIHFSNETPTLGAPFEAETRLEVGARQEAVFAEATSVPNPVSYVQFNSVRYADGSSWQPSDGEVCKTVPEPLRN